MHVRLLRGDFWKIDGAALQDFEALPEGPINVPVPSYGLCDLYTGGTFDGGCTFDYAILMPRVQ